MGMRGADTTLAIFVDGIEIQKIRYCHPWASLAGGSYALKIAPLRFLPQTAGMTEGRFLFKASRNALKSSRFSPLSLQVGGRDRAFPFPAWIRGSPPPHAKNPLSIEDEDQGAAFIFNQVRS